MSSDAVELAIPWRLLLSDNRKEVRVPAKKKCPSCGELVKVYRVIRSTDYSDRLDAIALLARSNLSHAPVPRFPKGAPLSLVAALHRPPGDRHDVTAFVKLVHDALEGSVYADDGQLDVVTWARGPTDAANPRAVIQVHPRGSFQLAAL